jgi:hypothetical protein
VYKPLIALESLNDQCRSILTKLLLNRYKVRITTVAGNSAEEGIRGSAWFAAFDPWHTCWRQPPGSFSLFDVAIRNGIINSDEVLRLSNALLRQGSNIAKIYNGKFSFFFREPRVQFLLKHAEDPQHFSDTGLAIGSSFVDYLFERCPWPLMPDDLEAKIFKEIPARGNLQLYAENPWLTWAESLDVVSVGPWLGLQAWEILNLYDALGQLAENKTSKIAISERIIGERVAIPFFSNGLQGIVLGFFFGIPADKKDSIHTTLLQFGQTLADAYSEMRVSRFISLLSAVTSLEDLAREAVDAFSPVAKIIVELQQRQAGYKLCYEHNYWAGYKQLTREEVESNSSLHRFTIKCAHGIAIHIEPITDVRSFDPDLFRIRLESGFRRILGPTDSFIRKEGLSIHEVQQRVRELETYMGDDKPSYAKMRQYYVAQQIERDLPLGETRVTNMKLKSFLQERTGAAVRNGYQISSYIGDVERVFPGKLKAEKTRYGVSISWKVAT